MRPVASIVVTLALATLAGCSQGQWLAFDDLPGRSATPVLAAPPPAAHGTSDVLAALSGEAPGDAPDAPPPPPEVVRPQELMQELDSLDRKMLNGTEAPPPVPHDSARMMVRGGPDQEGAPGGLLAEEGHPAGELEGVPGGVPGGVTRIDPGPAVAGGRASRDVARSSPQAASAPSGPSIGGAPAASATASDLTSALLAAGCTILSRSEPSTGVTQLMVKLQGELYAITFVPAGAGRSLSPRDLDKLEQAGVVRHEGGTLLAVGHADEAKASALMSKLLRG